jgi:hypothetical protein
MKKSTEQSTRDRVRRSRDKQAAEGRVRVELYLDRATLDIVDAYVREHKWYRSVMLEEMILTGLCFEGLMSDPTKRIEAISRKRYR